MGKSVAILQSNYLPWKGYFDMINAVDEFIIYDDMQFTRRDWRNRNKIKTPQGLIWITVPVKTKGKFHQSIRDTEIQGSEWATQHWTTIAANYRHATHFDELERLLHPLLRDSYSHISTLNRTLLDAITGYLGIGTKITNCWEYGIIDGKSDRLLDLCIKAGATRYVSGPAAKDYLDEALFERAGVEVAWLDYGGFPEYPQLWGPFEPAVSIIDVIANCGPESRSLALRNA